MNSWWWPGAENFATYDSLHCYFIYIRYQLNLMVAKIYVVSFIYVHVMHINGYDYIDYLDQYTILVEIFQM